MSEPDIAAKNYLSRNDRFADAFNFYLFEGEQVIHSDSLRRLDTASFAIIPHRNKHRKTSKQGYRDLFKLYTAMQNDEATYVMLGMEIQSTIHYAMPVRTMLYDAMSYAEQVAEVSHANREAKNLTGNAPYLSGLNPSDRLKPVLTLVLNLSGDEWGRPTRLHEILDIKNDALLPYLPDYRLNLLSPPQIDELHFLRFRTELGTALRFIKHRRDKDMSWLLDERFSKKEIDRETADLINTLTGANIRLPEGKETVQVWEAWENSLTQAKNVGHNEGRAEGRAEGRVEGRTVTLLSDIRRMIKNLHLAPEKAMDVLEVPTVERPALLAAL